MYNPLLSVKQEVIREPTPPGEVESQWDFGAELYNEQKYYPDNQYLPSMIVQPKVECPDEIEQNIEVTLATSADWKPLHEIGNEMFCLNNGRAIFPRIVYKITGLKHSSNYKIGIKLLVQSKAKFDFVRQDGPEIGKWVEIPSSKTIPGKSDLVPDESNEVFTDPTSGINLMDRGADLSNLYIYNIGEENRKSRAKASPRRSMETSETKEMESIRRPRQRGKTRLDLLVSPRYKYLPLMTLYEVFEGGRCEKVHEATFPETEFIVCTQYKHPEIRRLKCENKFCTLRARTSSTESPRAPKISREMSPTPRPPIPYPVPRSSASQTIPPFMDFLAHFSSYISPSKNI